MKKCIKVDGENGNLSCELSRALQRVDFEKLSSINSFVLFL